MPSALARRDASRFPDTADASSLTEPFTPPRPVTNRVAHPATDVSPLRECHGKLT